MAAFVAVFPVAYLLAFLVGLRKLLSGSPEGLLVFIVFGLPLYLTSLSVAYMLGYGWLLPALQILKELMVLLALGGSLWQLQKRLQPSTTDWLLLGYIAYATAYLFLPSGYPFRDKLVALKGVAFFPLLYFAGRIVDPNRLNLKKWLHYICLVTIAAGAVIAFEVWRDQHLQQLTGYADYNEHYFNVAPAGNYGLTWTFESGSGHKRFAAFYSMPLEHAAATLVSVSAIFALSFQRWGRYVLPPFLQVTLFACLMSIVFALSRAAFAGCFIMLYVYAFAAGKKKWLLAINVGILALVVAWLFWIKGDIITWVIETVNFTDTSSVSHLLEWIDGIEAISARPLGLGLGASGRVSGALGENIGGENQLIIIGVQLGVVAMILYIAIYYHIVHRAIRAFRSKEGKKARLGLMLLLCKVGLVIPLLTSELESYIYISYLLWFLSGVLINMDAQNKTFYATVPALGH